MRASPIPRNHPVHRETFRPQLHSARFRRPPSLFEFTTTSKHSSRWLTLVLRCEYLFMLHFFCDCSLWVSGQKSVCYRWGSSNFNNGVAELSMDWDVCTCDHDQIEIGEGKIRLLEIMIHPEGWGNWQPLQHQNLEGLGSTPYGGIFCVTMSMAHLFEMPKLLHKSQHYQNTAC